jgi:serine/threonine-protein kinase HipA
MAEVLEVRWGDVAVGELARDGGQITFTYSSVALERDLAISSSLPPRREPYVEADLKPFFDGLLPEGSARDRISDELRLPTTDYFSLLRELGRDCAGALVIIPIQENSPEVPGDVEWLSEEQLDQVVEELPFRPLGVRPEQGIRISLAGAQNKLVVVYQNGRIGLPRGTTPSTHILKPSTPLMRVRKKTRTTFPDLVANEALCLRLAHELGLPVAEVAVIAAAGQPALLVKRYDRRVRSNRTLRIHQEDFCQALGLLSDRKYERPSGPGQPVGVSIRDIARVLRQRSVRVDEDIDLLLDLLALSWLVGNCDAHGKNFSLLYTDDGPRLAPAYDVVSTEVYRAQGHTLDLAMSIGGTFDSRGVQAVHWRKELEQLDVNLNRQGSRLADLARRTPDALNRAREWVAEQGLYRSRLDVVGRVVDKRAGPLLELGAMERRVPIGNIP